MDLGHPLSVRDTAVSEVLSSALLSCMQVFHLLHTAQHQTVVGWATKATKECILGYQGSHLLFTVIAFEEENLFSWTWMESMWRWRISAQKMVIISPQNSKFMHKDKVHKNCKNKWLIYKKATEVCVPCIYYILILLLLFCVGKVGPASHHRRKFVCHKHALLPCMLWS